MTRGLLIVILFSIAMLIVGFHTELVTTARSFAATLRNEETGREQKQEIIADVVRYRVTVGKAEVTVEVADTNEERSQGLSGRASLPSGRGMLFLFPTLGQYGFWMKNVAFPLDMIWIADNKVVGIQKQTPVVPLGETPKVYYPPVPVTHVLEVNGGWAKARGVAVGSLFTATH